MAGGMHGGGHMGGMHARGCAWGGMCGGGVFVAEGDAWQGEHAW